MKKIHEQVVFLAVVFGGVNLLFSGDFEDYVVYNSDKNRIFPAPYPSDERPLLSSYSPSEFGIRLGLALRPKPQGAKRPVPVVDVVPDNDANEENDFEGSVFEAALVTPAQELATALNKFVLLGAARGNFRLAEQPSPVKRTRLYFLLEDLAEEAKKNPEQLKTLLQVAPSHLRKLLADCHEKEVTDFSDHLGRRELNSSFRKRKSFSGEISALGSIVTQSTQRRLSESFDRAVSSHA